MALCGWCRQYNTPVHLERDKALEFLEKVGVVDGEALLTRDPLTFVNTLISAFMTHLPFHSVSMMAQATEERHVPSLEEVVEAGLSLEGGACFTLNTFMCILLRALDLDAHVLPGTYSASPILVSNHVVALVRGLRCAEDEHIIDVGGGYPFLEAVAVSSLPVTFRHAGLEYTYRREGDQVLRLHRQGDDNPDGNRAVLAGEWRQVFHFQLTPVDYEFFRPYMESVYVNEESNFLTNLRAVRYPPAVLMDEDLGADKEDSTALMEDTEVQEEDTEVAEGDSRLSEDKGEAKKDERKRMLVAMRNQSILLGSMDAVVKMNVTIEEWATKLKHFFPTIPPAKIDCAVKNKIHRFNLS